MRKASDGNGTNKPITLQNIADHCGVTRASVSMALRGKPGISEQTTARIRQVAEEMGYDPALNQGARRLVLHRLGQKALNQVIGLFLVPYFNKTTYYSSIYAGILDALTEDDFALLTTNIIGTEVRPLSLPPIYRRGEVDGVIVISVPSLTKSLIEKLRHASAFGDRPVTSLIHRIPDASHVLVDDERGGYLAARHLLDLGHRHLLLVDDGNSYEPLRRRIAGIERAMVEDGLEPERYLQRRQIPISLMPQHYLDQAYLDDLQGSESSAPPLMEFLMSHPEITGIVAQNDPVARRIWYLAQHAGLRIPDDISLIGFDDTDHILNAAGENVLTSVRLPLYDVGYQAAKRIVRRAIGEQAEDDTLVLPVELIIRASTSAPAC